MDREFKVLAFEIKASNDGSEFEGHGNAFHTIDSYYEIVAPGAFLETIPQFLDVGFIGGLNHDWDHPIGKPTDAREDVKGLFLQAKISDTVAGREVKTLLKDKVIKRLSIGYKVKGAEWLETAEDVATYWEQHNYQPNVEDIARSQYGARLLTKLHLYEVSPVTVPANTMAEITRVKQEIAAEITTEREFEHFLIKSGFAREAAKKIASCGFKSLRQRDVEEETEPTAPVEETEPKLAPVTVKRVPVDQALVRSLYIQHLQHQSNWAARR